MNCPSRADETTDHQGWNQSPSALSADLTTRQDLNGIANSRAHRGHIIDPESSSKGALANGNDASVPSSTDAEEAGVRDESPTTSRSIGNALHARSNSALPDVATPSLRNRNGRSTDLLDKASKLVRTCGHVLVKYGKFVGPGFMISVAYIDPGNYSTDVSAGASAKFGLLFVVLMSNVFAIFLQSLCVKLGTVTGLSLAENCRAHLPRWLNIALYILAEAAIIATDIAEVS